ncbi:response regulator transcription factor [Ideonella sp.]|uniref:response regulator transcription factor n=1 Tax=Ideonella sp. TaxID=1929293 RepID=UPI0035B36272
MGKNILIVEDHADIRRLIRMTLEMEDHQLREVSRAEQAIAEVAKQPPDLVLLDVCIPGGMNGVQLCRRWRQNRWLDGMRIVMLTGRSASEDLNAGIDAGADAYMLKPFSPMQLIQTIESQIVAPRGIA